MTLIANTSTSERYPAVSFKSIGDSVGGRIVHYEEYQEQDFYTKEPKVWPKSGDPVMGVRITLETNPGDVASRVQLWASGRKMLQAIAKAVKDQGANDIAEGADLAVTFTGFDGRAKTYQAAYAAPESAPF